MLHNSNEYILRRIYQKLNQPEKAIPLLRKIRDSYAESSLAPQARQLLTTLE